MKKTWKRLLAALLTVGMLFSDASLVYVTEAAQVEELQKVTYTETHINPLYEGMYTEADLVSDDAVFVMSAEDIECYTDINNMAKDIRDRMVNRETVISVKYEYQGSYSQEYITEVMNSAFDQAVEHTGNPVEGDYLKYQYVGWGGNIESEVNGNTVSVTFTYMPTYFTTAEQELQMNQTVNALLNELSLDDSTDYEKVTKIYDYVCENITYDFTNLNDNNYKLKHSAYAALINKTAVCQGYAVLFYRLALELGIDARVITGYANGDHAWNIVKLNNIYYNLDSTWDAGITPYNYYLKNMDDFLNHTRSDEFSDASFGSRYPMAAVSYDPDASVNQSPEYNGTVKNNDGNNEILYIRAWEMENLGLTFSESAVLDILNKRIAAGESFAQVMIDYPNNPGVVSKEVWNAVKELMNNTEWSAGFLFSGNNLMDENWFVADMQTATNDVVLDAELTLGEAGEYGKVTFGNTAIPARGVHISFNTAHWNDGTPEGTGGRDDYGKFVAAFGTASCRLDLLKNGTAVEDTSVRYEYYSENPGNDNLTVCVDFVNRLEANVKYSLTKRVYAGERDQWDDGTTIFRVEKSGFENAGESFSEAAVLSLLQKEAAMNSKYDRVELSYPAETTKVAKEVWNAAAALLTNSDARTITISIERSSTVPLQEWSFMRANTVNTDVVCVADLAAGNSGEGINFRFSQTNVVGENISVRFNMDSEDSYFASYEAALGYECYEMKVTNPDGVLMENSGGYYDYMNESWGKGININIGGAAAGAEKQSSFCWYHLDEKVYIGNVNSWTEDGKLYSSLEISPNSGNKLSFTDDEVVEILKNHSGKKYNVILIEQRLGNHGISTKVANEAVKYLADPTEDRPGELRFGFWDNSESIYAQWIIRNPKPQNENHSISYKYEAKAGENPTVQISNPKILADGVSVQLNVHRDHPLNYFNHTLAALGETPGPVILQGTQVRGWYEYDEYGLWMNIDMISPLDSNETYVVCPWEGEETPVIEEIKVEILENGLPMNGISQPGKTDIYLMNSKIAASKKVSYPLEAKVKYSPDEDYSDYLNEADLTWTTSDKKLAEVSVNPMTGEAVLNIKKGAVGTVEITAAANDGGNESYTFELMIVDTAVRVDSSKLTMNSYLEKEGILKVYPNVSYLEKAAELLGVDWDVTISVLQGNEVFEVDTDHYNKVTGELGVRFVNEEEANKTFTLKLQVNQYVGEFETEEILTFKITNKKVQPKLTLKAVTPYNIAYMNEAAYAEVMINLSAPVAGTESDPAIYMDSDIFRLESLRKISDTQWSAKLSMKDEPELKVNQTKSFSMKAAVRYDGYRMENTASVKVSATNKAPSISVYGNEAYKTALYPQLSLEEAKVLVAVPAGFGETGMYADAVNGVLVLGNTTVSLPEKIAKSFEIVGGEFVSGAASVDSKGNKVTVGDALLITVRTILGEKAKSGNIQFVVENNDVISNAVTTKALKVYVEKVTSLAMSMIVQQNGKKTTSATFQKSFAGKEVLTLLPSIPEQIVNIYKMNGMNPSEHLILKVEPADKNAVKVFENGTLSIEENSEGNVEIKTTEALFEEGVSSCKVKFTVYATNNGLESALKSVNFTVKLQKKDTMVSAKAAAKGNLNVVAADSKVTVTPTFANLPMGAQVVGVDFVNATDAAFYKINDVQNNSGVLTICKYAIDTVLPIANTVPLAYKIQLTDGTLHTVEAAVKINVTQTATVKADVKSVVLYNSVVGASYGKDVVFTETKSGAAIKNIEFTGLENSGISTKQIAGENGERIVTFYVDGEKDRGPKKSYTAKATVTLDGAGTKKGKEITYTTSVKVTLNN